MKTLSTIVATAALALTFAAPAMAQTYGYAPSVEALQSMRTSQLIGSPVFNEQGQNIGSIVDGLVKNSPAEPTAILSVGDYVGGGKKLVAVPLSHVKRDGGKQSLAGATTVPVARPPS